MEDGSGYGSGYERGARRRKLAGYLRAANEIRQSYQKQYGLGGRADGAEEFEGMPGAFPDASVVRNGEEELLLFPSYARRHKARDKSASDMPGASEDIRSTQSTGDAEYWKREWDKYEDQNAVVEVNVRGWTYAPQRGSMSRKNRLLVGIARQLSGIPAPTGSGSGSRTPSPHSLHGRIEAHNAKHEGELVEREAETIARRGQGEAEVAQRGGYSEIPSKEVERMSLRNSLSRSRSGSPNDRVAGALQRPVTSTSLSSDVLTGGPAKRASWNQPSQMSPEELATANANLMLRLRPFLTTPLVQMPLTVFFYNDETSKSRTVTTNEAGHFHLRALLDFVPTQVRVLASDKLSATEEVRIIETSGVSLISDIDDTIKHTAIGSGAREIFRNAFIRDLNDLTIDGVREWYSRLFELGVKFHYVSNAPWQLYPALVEFFSKAGLPQGSFHLKQYTGMLQGIFEPVAERKKGTLDRILSDFPERKFILIGDSGEADLELYIDILLANPGRILGVFIRDVTTSGSRGSLDANKGPSTSRPPAPFRGRSTNASSMPSARFSDSQADDPPPPLPPRLQARTVPSQAASKEVSDGVKTGILIDLDAEPAFSVPQKLHPFSRNTSEEQTLPAKSQSKSPPPSLPSKPLTLRSNSSGSQSAPSPAFNPTVVRKPIPPPAPKPRQYAATSSNSTTSYDPSPLSQIQVSSPSDSSVSPAGQQSYRSGVKKTVSSAYNLPSLPSSLPSANTPKQSPRSIFGPSSTNGTSHSPPTADNTPPRGEDRPPPPIPPRRNFSSYSVAAAQYLGNAASSRLPNVNVNALNPYSTSTNKPTTSLSSSASNNPAAGGSSNGQATDSSYGYGSYDPTISKKEETWLRRWARAQEIFEEKGVPLHSWRVGSDVQAEAVRLVQAELKREKEKRGKGPEGKGEKEEGLVIRQNRYTAL